MTVEQKRPVINNESAGPTEPKRPWEPTTFAERVIFLRKVARAYLDGKITWGDKWFYTQEYGPGAPGEKTS